MNRSKPALHPRLIESSLRAYAPTAGLRAEEHGRFSDFFVDSGAGYVDTLLSPDWQLIYGRRGTGKTHLLGYFAEEAALKDRWIVNITAQRLHQRSAGADVPLVTRSRELFVAFLGALTVDIAHQAEPYLPNHQHGDTRGQLTSSRALSNIVQLLDLSESAPVPHPSGSDYPAARLQTERQQYVALAEQYGALLVEVLEDLKIEKLYICIDEWSTLDPTGATVIQPEFADLLKIAFKGTNRISLKVATNRFQTQMNNQSPSRAFRGLELGADITEAINLDHLALEHDELHSFYTRMIFKRLQAHESGLGVFEVDGHVNDQFILSIFHDERAFEELVVGADAIPRNFLRIVSKMYSDRGYDPRNRWKGSAINEEIRARGATGSREIGYRTQAHQLMAFAIRPIVGASKRREFLVRTSDSLRLKRGFDELFEKRLIHELPDHQVPAMARHEYDGFRLDYGVLLDWLDLPFDEQVPTTGRRSPIDEDRWRDLIVEVSNIEVEMLECPTCQTEFSPEAPSFRARRLCPHCFEETGLRHSFDVGAIGSDYE